MPGMVWFLAGLAVGVAWGITLLASLGRMRRELEQAQQKAASAQAEVAPLLRQLHELQGEHRFMSEFLNELPHLTRELHSGISARRIPTVLLNIVTRTMH